MKKHLNLRLIRHVEAKYPEGVLADPQKHDRERPITQNGWKQLVQLRKATLGFSDVVICSPTLRTRTVAYAIAGDVPVIELDALCDPDLTKYPVEFAALWAAYMAWGSDVTKWLNDRLAAEALQWHAHIMVHELHQVLGGFPSAKTVSIVGHGVYLNALALAIASPKHGDAFRQLACGDALDIKNHRDSWHVKYLAYQK